jgi:hypothetical protein
MGFHKQQAAKAATQTGPAAPVTPKVQGPWPSMLTSAFLTLFGPLGTGLRFSYLEQNPASHPLARTERQLVATLFGITSLGIATPFIGWKRYKASKGTLNLILAILSTVSGVGFFGLVTVGVLSGEGSALYGLTQTLSTILLPVLLLLIPLIGFRVPKPEKNKEEDKTPEQN